MRSSPTVTTFHRKCAGAVFLASLALSGCAHAASDWSHPGDNPLIVGGTFGLLFAAAVWGTAEHFSRNPVSTYTKVKWLSGLVLGGLLALCLMALLSGKTDSGLKTFVAIAYMVFALPHAGLIYVHRNSARQYVDDQARKKREAEEQREAQKVALEKAKKAAAAAELERSEKRKKAMEKKKARKSKEETMSTSKMEKIARLGELLEHPIIIAITPAQGVSQLQAILAQINQDGLDSVSDRIVEQLLTISDEKETALREALSRPPAFVAVQAGDLAALESALDGGFDINASIEDNRTLLGTALEAERPEIFECLLRRGADFNRPIGSLPVLAVACMLGNRELVALLIKHGVDINTRFATDSRNGPVGNQTALSYSAAKGEVSICELLIKHGADLEVVSDVGNTPLMWALTNGASEEVAVLLLEAGANPDPDITSKLDFAPTRTPLTLAAQNGMDSAVEVLLARGAEVDKVDADGCTPLKLAAHGGHSETVSLLLQAGASTDIADHEGWTPLIAAASKGHLDVCRQLLEAGADVSHVADSGATALAQVVEFGEVGGLTGALQGAISSLSRLLGTDDDVNAGAVGSATSDETLEVVRLMLDKGADPSVVDLDTASESVRTLLVDYSNPKVSDSDGSMALVAASGNGDLPAVRALLANGADPNQALPSGQTALSSAVVNGHSRVVDFLLDAGAAVNAIVPEGRFGAFALALDNKKMRIALRLLQRGAEVNFGDSDTLPLAVAEHGSIELLREIDARGGSGLAAFGARAAFVAARNKDPEVLDYLLSQGIDLSTGNDLGYTPLILASLANFPSLVQRYLERGDDPNVRDVDGETALSLAIEKEHRSVIQILRAANAQTTDYGDLPPAQAMLRASREGALGTILNLRDLGVSINVSDEQGNTPLMLAAQAGWVGVVRSLFHLGADINQKNLAGKSASNLAKEAGQEKVLKTLMEFGADDALHDVYGIDPPESNEGSRKTVDMADTLMGRYSHPFKDKLPYDESGESDDLSGEDEEEDEETEDKDETGATSDEDQGDDAAKLSEKVSSMLDALEELISKPHIQERLSESNRDLIEHRVNLIRSEGEDAVPDEQLDELFKLVEFFQQQSEGEEPPPPLFEAAAEGDLQEFRKLVKAGADIKETLPDGTTLLMTAAEHDQNAIIQELIKRGVDVNQRKQDSFSALLIACFLGHDDVVKTLAKHGADINERYEIGSSEGVSGGLTALTVVAQKDNAPLCSLLLKLGADVDAVSDAGYTPLMASLVNGASEDAAQVLLKAGANPDPDVASRTAIATSTTPLILAATNGMTDIVKALLKRNVAVDKSDGEGWTALKRAANDGHEAIVKLLLKAGASPDIADNEGWTALINASGKGHIGICKALLKAGADVNATGARGRTPLLQAIGARSDSTALDALKAFNRMFGGGDEEEEGEEESSLDLIRILLKAGADPSTLYDGTSLLAKAIEDDDEELVKLLKKHGAVGAASPPTREISADSEPEPGEGRALLAAALHADPKRLRELVVAGADVNHTSAQGLTALSVLLSGLHDESNGRMFRRNAEQCLDYLLNHGADPGIGDPSPFALAAMGRRLHLIQKMISAGVDVNKSIGEGQTALFLSLLAPGAGEPVDDRCAVALLKAGADSSPRHESGAMPIHLAAASNYLGALGELLERRPQDVNATTNIGITPLMMAATEGHAEAVRMLLAHGADRGLTDQEGLTAKDVAIKNGNDELIPLLS